MALQNSLFQFEELSSNTEHFITELGQTNDIQHAMTTPDPLRLNSLFELIQEIVPNSSAIKLGLENGNVFMKLSAAVPSSYDPREQIWYTLGKANDGHIVWTGPYLDYLNQKIIITASNTVRSSLGNMIGVLAVDFDLSTISRFINNSQIGRKGFIMLLNQSGTVVANVDGYWIGERLFGDELERITKAAQTEQTEYRIKGKTYYLKFGKLNESGMMIVTGINKQEINEELWSVHLPIFILGVICLGVFGFVANFFALKAIVPLERLVALMKSAENGNYHVHANIRNYNEIESLANGFNHMMEGIRKKDEDLTASKEEVYMLAYYDSLTGLLNRRNILETIMLAIRNNPECEMALIYIDLDNFKTINDTTGHALGDCVLAEVAKRLEAIPYTNKNVARIGGDEFIMALHDIESNAAVEKILNQIVWSLEKPLQLRTQSYNVSASIGVALYPKHGSSTEELMQKADMAMYRAKANGKNRYSIFDESIQREIARKASIEHGIREALRGEQFELYYQPIYDAFEGKFCSVEALLRSNSPALDGIPMSQIIPRAEESRLIVSVDKWVLKSACEYAKQLNEGLSDKVRVSVNVSAKHIMQQDFVDDVKNIIAKSGVNPEWIGLEITETVMIESFDTAKKKLEELKKLNVQIYLDDFGTGYSSLNYLKNLPIDYVKIDQSFVQSMLHSDRDGRITKTIVELSHNIGLKVIAEGVETKDQAELLRLIQCDMFQGYYIGKPMNANESTKFLHIGSAPFN